MNKAITGANAFAHESGIHQDGMLKHSNTYEIMTPEDVGISGTELVLGKHSGRHAFRDHMEKLGFAMKAEELQKAFESFIRLADKKKTIYDDDLVAIVREQVSTVPHTWELDYVHVSTGNTTVPTATVRLRKGDDVTEDAACGDGPVDAALKSIDRITKLKGKLLDFSLQSVTRGKDAVGEVSVQVSFGGTAMTGKSSSTDIVEAGARAYLNCVNRYLYQLERAQEGVKGKKKAVTKKKATRKKAPAKKKAAAKKR